MTAEMVVSFTTVKLDAATPPIVTAVAPVRLVPTIVTVVPPNVVPLLGVTDVVA